MQLVEQFGAEQYSVAQNSLDTENLESMRETEAIEEKTESDRRKSRQLLQDATQQWDCRFSGTVATVIYFTQDRW